MFVYTTASSNKGDSAGECPDKLQACQVVGPCTFYDVSRLKCNSGARVRARDTETDGFIDEVENLKRELADRDKVLEVFIVKARSAQKWIAVIYFILGVVFTLTVLLLLKVRGMMNGSRPYSSSLL